MHCIITDGMEFIGHFKFSGMWLIGTFLIQNIFLDPTILYNIIINAKKF